VRFCWCDEETFVAHTPKIQKEPWMWKYDRRFDRPIDPSRILRVTGLGKEDFLSVAEGIRIELDRLGWKRPETTE